MIEDDFLRKLEQLGLDRTSKFDLSQEDIKVMYLNQLVFQAMIAELKALLFKHISTSTNKSEEELEVEYEKSLMRRLAERVSRIVVDQETKDQEPS